MSNMQIIRRIKYQGELDLGFAKEVAAMPGGEDIFRCIQCGTCSSTCPVSVYMDQTPRRIIAMTRAGFKDDVLASNTIWLCSSCYSCTVECPKSLRITEIMYSLKQKAIADKAYPKNLPIPVLAKEFFKSVLKTGRSNEGRTVARVWLKTNPMKMLSQAGLGLKLMRRGRMSMKTERMTRGHEQMSRMLDAVETARSARRPH
jgi:quinone-modifying oxidoreductase subunit QmoC